MKKSIAWVSSALVVIIISNFQLVCCEFEDQLSDVVVTTSLGKIRGTTLTSRLGINFQAFRGIRYAKPPVGELRFKAPEPVEQWSTIFDATVDGPMCPQPNSDPSEISEDCLRLNVYTRELPSESNPNKKRPVLVFLHPGGFYSVSGQSKNFAGPQTLMDRDIVLVTLNYRLASLGFMATGTVEATGNAGLKDQVLALKWIKLHIHKFGGDPDSVTLMGYSAGAMSITLHMVSPMSRGLFHKAIVMSGAATAQWEIPDHQLHLAKKQAKLLNCSDENTVQMVNCLKTKNALEFGNSLYPLLNSEGHPILLWLPVIEPDFGQERFLIEDPVRQYQEGRFMKIPVIAGITKDEFVGPAVYILNNETLRREMDNNFEKLAPVHFLYERETRRSANISAELRRFYLGNESLQPERSLEGLSHLFADGVIGFGMHRFVHLAARLTQVFYYRFSYVGRYSHLYHPGDTPYGAVHHDDMFYLFALPKRAPTFTANDPEHLTVERMTRMWTNFAEIGDPNKPSDEVLKTVRWTPFNYLKKPYLDIGNELIMKEGLYADRYEEWKRLFPLTWIPKRKPIDSSVQDEDYPAFEE